MNIRKIVRKTKIILLIVVVVSGCGKLNKGQKRIASYDIPNYQAEVIIEGIKTKNASIIAEQFCPYVKENYPDLEERIDEWMEFVNGEVISYDKPESFLSSGSVHYGEVRLEFFSAKTKNVKTSTGKTYLIGHEVYTACKEHPEYVGVHGISIRNEDQYDKDTGYPETAECILDFPETYMWQYPER